VTDKRISWPVGLTGGFQPTLTARENLQFVCRVHGATGATMRRVLDFVADFAEIGEYFDLPIASYSSGMRSRVAFGASMAFDFDYYLIDEVTAVGDPQFKRKSQLLLQERLKNANVILVSHRTGDILRNCDVVVLVDKGDTVLFDNVREGIAAYVAQGGTPVSVAAAREHLRANRRQRRDRAAAVAGPAPSAPPSA
jgi:capsular polysaccharide transport system ATP-binding protein